MAHFTALPFDDIRGIIAQLALNSEKQDLGDDLASLAASYRNITGKKQVLKPFCVAFATSHGFSSEQDRIKTRTQLEAASSGESRLNKLCANHDIGLKVFDLAIDHPCKNIRTEAAFQENECAATIAYGMEAIAGEPDLVIITAFSEGGQEVANAIFDGLKAKQEPLELLRRKGGRDICAILGAIIAARLQRVPLILDGVEANAALALLNALQVNVNDHCIESALHIQQEAGVNGVLNAALLKSALASC